MLKDLSITLVQCPSWSREAPPLAISLLAGNLRSNGYKVHLHDFNNELYHIVLDEHKSLWDLEEYTFWSSEESVNQFIEEYNSEIDEEINKIIETGSKLVGFTLYFTTLYFTLEIIKRLKSRSPNTLIVLGGPSTDEHAGGLELLDNPNVDAVVIREGDETLPEMCTVLKEKGRLIKMPGLAFKEGNQIIYGGIRNPIPSLDTIPFPDYSDFELTRYKLPESLNFFSSRSCVNKCHYCSERNYFMLFRVRSGKSLFEEVQFQLSYFPNVKFFNFNDSVFNGSLKTVREFSELLLKNNVRIVWGGQGIIRDMTPELLNLMAKAGCVSINFGVETGSDTVRKSMNKNNFTNKLAAKLLKDTHDAGIKVTTNFMFGYPTETEEDFQMTLNFIRQNYKWIDHVYPSNFFTSFMPGTYLYENSEMFGVGPNMHYLYWETKDCKNTYPIRFERFERFCRLCIEVGFDGRLVPEEKVDKWKLLGHYYRFKKDYEKAIECYKIDLLKHGYSPESVRFFLECSRYGEEIDRSNPYKGLDKLISYYDDTIKSLSEQIIQNTRS